MPINAYSQNIRISYDKAAFDEDLQMLSVNQKIFVKGILNLAESSDAFQDQLITRKRTKFAHPKACDVQAVEFAWGKTTGNAALFRVRFFEKTNFWVNYRWVYVFDPNQKPAREIRFLAIVKKGTEPGEWNYDFDSEIGKRIKRSVDSFCS